VAIIAGWAHVTLSVRDHDVSVRWYCDVLGFEPIASEVTDQWKRTLCQHPDAGIVLVLHQNLANGGDAFDERCTGLDHLAFAVSDYDALVAWEQQLDRLGVSCTPIKDAPPRGGKVLHFRDPDHIPLELFWRPQPAPDSVAS
jgi:glyoxylase I family protein